MFEVDNAVVRLRRIIGAIDSARSLRSLRILPGDETGRFGAMLVGEIVRLRAQRDEQRDEIIALIVKHGSPGYDAAGRRCWTSDGWRVRKEIVYDNCLEVDSWFLLIEP